jgi:hypothetical protein
MKAFLKLACMTLLWLEGFTAQAMIVTNISVGSSSHSLFLKSDESLWVMVLNSIVQLGDGTNFDVLNSDGSPFKSSVPVINRYEFFRATEP